ncbi:hypothetical protein GCM10010399_17830 [Dactylosporangium fulvum]
MATASSYCSCSSSPQGRVVEWIEGDPAWEIIDRLVTKYTDQSYPRGQERVVALIEPKRQTVGVG